MSSQNGNIRGQQDVLSGLAFGFGKSNVPDFKADEGISR